MKLHFGCLQLVPFVWPGLEMASKDVFVSSSLTKLMLVEVGTCLPITWVGHGIHLHVQVQEAHLFLPLISTWIFRAFINHDQCCDGLKSIFRRANCIVQTCTPLTISSNWLLYLRSCKIWKHWLPEASNRFVKAVFNSRHQYVMQLLHQNQGRLINTISIKIISFRSEILVFKQSKMRKYKIKLHKWLEDRKIPKISPSNYKPPKLVMQKTPH